MPVTKILLVEDNAEDAEMTMRALRKRAVEPPAGMGRLQAHVDGLVAPHVLNMG